LHWDLISFHAYISLLPVFADGRTHFVYSNKTKCYCRKWIEPIYYFLLRQAEYYESKIAENKGGNDRDPY